MNYLAHLLLSGDNPVLRLGNLSGDFVKGINVGLLHPTIQKGIALHRAIDAFTDCHAIVCRSKSRVGLSHTRIAGVLVDVFYDHFLALDWPVFSAEPLNTYVQQVYADLQTYDALLPPLLRCVAPEMTRGDWLTAYRGIDGIARALHRIEQRLPIELDPVSGIKSLEENYVELRCDFGLFFPELAAHAKALVEQSLAGIQESAI